MRNASLIVLALAGGAAGIVAFSGEEPAKHAAADERSPFGMRAKSQRRHTTNDQAAQLAHEFASAPLARLHAQLPETAPKGAYLPLSPSLQAALFEMGRRNGEDAVDEIVARYQQGYFTGRALGFVLAGWMKTDREAAIAAFHSMTTPEPHAFLCGMRWKGTDIVSGLG